MTAAERIVFDQCREALLHVLNSACHPDIALRAVLVNLDPVRKALKATESLTTAQVVSIPATP